jgi:hypothetical protein
MGVALDLDPRTFRQALGQFATGGAAAGGDHVISVGRVERFTAYPRNEPLIVFRGTYRSLANIERSPEWPLPIHY